MFQYPKKSLGQHFLSDKNMIAKMISSFELLEGEKLLEIGPGRGALTHELLKYDCDLISIELDTALAKYWQDIAKERENFKCIEANALKIDWSAFLPIDKLIGNIPYNISRPLLYKVFKHRKDIKTVIFMVQKEFADKLVAQPSDNAYGILAVLAQSFAKVELLFTISPSVFFPRPKVMSACIKLDLLNLEIDDELFIKLVQIAFNQRRRTLKNSIKQYYLPDLEDKIDWKKRADQLKPEDYVGLVNILPKNDKIIKT